MKRFLIYAVIGASITAALVLALMFTPLSLNHPPKVTISQEKRVTGGTVVLSPDSVVDEDGDPLTYNWTQISGDQVVIFNSTTSTPTFSIAPSPLNRTLSFQLDVSDGKVTKPTIVNLIVLANKPPIANAGEDQIVGKGDRVVLDGSLSSDVEGAPLNYRWIQVSGLMTELSNATSVKPTFVAPSSTDSRVLSFQLIVNDGMADSKPSIVKITVKPDEPPVANAGPDQIVNNGETVELSGLGSSDPDKDRLTYQWTQTSGPVVELSNPTVARPTFKAPSFVTDKILTFQLVVNDGTVDSRPDTVRITVKADRQPIANAGQDRTVPGEAQVTLDGTDSSDPDGDTLTYQWKQMGGESVQLSDPMAAKPTFKAPVADTDKVLTFQLVVNDGTVDSRPDTVRITVKAIKPPIANAGEDKDVAGDTTVTLDGSKSSAPDGSRLKFTWKQVLGPKVELSNANSTKPTFKAPPRGADDKVLEFQLVVNDGTQDSEPDTVKITVKANRAPIADAGSDQRVNEHDEVTLDGSKSSDPDGDTLTYQWKQLEGSNIRLKYADEVEATFVAPSVTSTKVFKFQLTVSDGTISKTDIVQVTVRPG